MWNQKYASSDYFYGTEPNRWLAMNASRLPATGRALALADGEGRNGVYLASLGLETLSVDLSEVGLAKANKLAQAKCVELKTLQADLAEYQPEPESLDLAVAIYAHFPTEVRIKAHAACAVGLKPGGLFVLEGFHPEQLAYTSGGPKSVDMLYTVEKIMADFEGFQVLEAHEGLTHLQEGRHDGLGYVTRLVLRKP